MAVRHNSARNAEGNMTGQDPQDKIGFYGTTPIVQQVLATGATAAQIVAALTALGLVRNT
jgi:hypothetical protein